MKNTKIIIAAVLVVILAVVGVVFVMPAVNYNKAMSLLTEGKYDEAIMTFNGLKEYKDSPVRVVQAKADKLFAAQDYAGAYEVYLTLGLDYQTHAEDYAALYDKAVGLRDKGDYDGARAAFAGLGSYNDSAVQINETTYIEAGSLAAAGKFNEAEALYTSLGAYSDSETKIIQTQADRLYASGKKAAAAKIYGTLGEAYQTHEADYAQSYANAETDRTEGRYEQAAAGFKALGTYRDSAAQVTETMYQYAQASAARGEYDFAIELYDTLGNYGDSRNLKQQAQADQLFAAGKYADAHDIYTTLGDAYQTHKADYEAMYAQAETDRTAGNYVKAAEGFAALGGYSDAAAQQTETMYQYAQASAAKGEYDTAIQVYGDLKGYKDSANLAVQAAADQLYDAGDLAGAYDVYATLGESYQTHAEDYKQKYDAAAQALTERRYEDARTGFLALGGYSDAAAQAADVGRVRADDAFTDERYHDAAELYRAIGDEDKATLSLYKEAGQLAGAGKTREAAALYLSLGDYEDSREQHYQLGLSLTGTDAVQVLAEDMEYSDAREQIYQLGVAASDAKQYEVSTCAFAAAGQYKNAAMKLTMDSYAWGKELMEAGEYDKAAEVFVSMGDFSDAPQLANEARYAAAGVAMANGRYDNAAARYAALGSFSDSADKTMAARYAAANEQLEAGHYVDAKNRFNALGDYSDSKAKAQESDYRLAMALFNAGDYAGAKAAFRALGSYSDSVNMARECDYIPAKALYEEGKYADALAVFENLTGYKDSDAIMTDCCYQLGQAAMAGGDYAAARDWFDKAGSYKDSKAQADECRRLIALNAAGQEEKNGHYETAYAQYELAGETGKMQEMAYERAIELISEGKYEDAIAWFETAGDYKDVKEQILFIGEYYFATQQYDLAEAVFVKVLGTGNSAQRLYELGQYYELQDNYEHAAQCYREAGAYEDAPEKAKEVVYRAAESLFQTEDWEGARTEYLKISGYKDVDSKVATCDNEIAAAAARAYTEVGSIVTYGHYEQDNNISNGKEDIEWIVLAYDSTSGKSLLISRYGLDAHRFDAKVYQGWDKSEIRSWLNSTFLNNAFTAKEQEGIVTTKVSTPSYSGNSGGSDTQDKLWLLSRDEATTYFGNAEARKAIPTKYAVAQGASQSSSNKLNGTGCCWWWLRSPGYLGNCASDVYNGGSLDYSRSVRITNGSVRPAFWLNLDSVDIY